MAGPRCSPITVPWRRPTAFPQPTLPWRGAGVPGDAASSRSSALNSGLTSPPPWAGGMLAAMLKASDISKAGTYWYRADPIGDWTAVEIGPQDAPKADLEVRFAGREDWDMLIEMAGEFDGPIAPPPA